MPKVTKKKVVKKKVVEKKNLLKGIYLGAAKHLKEDEEKREWVPVETPLDCRPSKERRDCLGCLTNGCTNKKEKDFVYLRLSAGFIYDFSVSIPEKLIYKENIQLVTPAEYQGQQICIITIGNRDNYWKGSIEELEKELNQ